jgi:citrate lyase beta subunit
VRLCAPVSDRTSDTATLQREIQEDIHRGLFAKTAIHPRQVEVIWDAYLPDPGEVEEATRILAPDAAAVFSLNGDMLEPACHSEWARRLLHRHALHRSVQNHRDTSFA